MAMVKVEQIFTNDEYEEHRKTEKMLIFKINQNGIQPLIDFWYNKKIEACRRYELQLAQ